MPCIARSPRPRLPISLPGFDLSEISGWSKRSSGAVVRWCLVWCCLLLSTLTGWAADPARSVDALLAKAPKGAKCAVAMADLTDRRWILVRNADEPLSLASTTKLVVSAAALLGLGPDFQFTTRLVGLGPLTTTGSLPGLGVIGGGSPCFDEHFATGRDPDNVFREFAANLRERGVQRIDGDIVIDTSLFAGPIRPDTWPADQANQQRWFSAPAAAFAWNDNCIEVRIIPTKVGQPCRIETRPASDRIRIVNKTRSLSSGAGRNAISRSLNSNTIVVSGTCGQKTSWFPLAIATDPDLLIGDHLKEILVTSGIPVTGEVRLATVDPTLGPELVIIHQPLVPAVNILNQRSHNFYGEQILRLIGNKHAGEGSIDAGRRATLTIIEENLGAGMGPITLLDGCGLSYENRASAKYLVNLLDGMHRHDLRDVFYNSLKTMPAAGIVGHVKTGTHNESRALAGYLTNAAGRRYGFAILLNRADATSIGWADKLRGQIYQALASAVAP